MNFRLNYKKERVLKLLIEEYIKSARPVGSKYLARLKNLGLSPASVRNYFAEFEELGLVFQPHPSAGRVPTDLGFRYYVNYLIKPHLLEEKWEPAVKSLFSQLDTSPETFMQQIPKVLSQLSHQIGILLRPWFEQVPLNDIYLLKLDFRRILIIFIFEDQTVEHKILKNKYKLKPSDLHRLNNYLSRIARGKTLLELKALLLDELKSSSHQNLEVLKLWKLSEDIAPEGAGLCIAGGSNLASYPEFAGDKLKEVLRVLEDRKILIQLLDESLKCSGVRVVIGKEHPFPQMHSLAMITVNYFNKECKPIGSVGVIGPKRMDYENIISLVNYIAQTISEKLRGAQ